ncbi:MAG TPA: HAMP domain-containing sensor histidine kinase, partial [Acidimicrobiales bacterium]
DGSVAEIVVCDNGPGVPEEQLARVFGLFERIEGSPYPGTGVGLAICRRVVEHRGGRIWMERNDGPGVSVHVRLPVAVPAS